MIKENAISRFLEAYHEPRSGVDIKLGCDENLRICIAASFGGKVWSGEVIFGKEDKKAKISDLAIENFDLQTKSLLAATRRTLLKKGIISE